jgi:DNA-binding PadR family transcriptional regulator
VAFSSIYPLLAGLERQGLVVAEPGPADAGPERILYSLTTAGRAALAAAVRDAIGGPPGDRPGMQLALMFRHVLSAEELVALFQRRSTAIDAELDRTQRERSSLGPWQEYAGLIFDHQRLHLVAEQEFLRIAIARIGAAGWKPGAWKPGG